MLASTRSAGARVLQYTDTAMVRYEGQPRVVMWRIMSHLLWLAPLRPLHVYAPSAARGLHHKERLSGRRPPEDHSFLLSPYRAAVLGFLAQEDAMLRVMAERPRPSRAPTVLFNFARDRPWRVELWRLAAEWPFAARDEYVRRGGRMHRGHVDATLRMGTPSMPSIWHDGGAAQL